MISNPRWLEVDVHRGRLRRVPRGRSEVGGALIAKPARPRVRWFWYLLIEFGGGRIGKVRSVAEGRIGRTHGVDVGQILNHQLLKRHQLFEQLRRIQLCSRGVE